MRISYLAWYHSKQLSYAFYPRRGPRGDSRNLRLQMFPDQISGNVGQGNNPPVFTEAVCQLMFCLLQKADIRVRRMA